MKKYIMSAIAAAIAIASLVLTLNSANFVVIAGAGNGKNAEITTLTDACSTLDFITTGYIESEIDDNIDNALDGVLDGAIDDVIDDALEDQGIKQFSSITYTIDSTLSTKKQFEFGEYTGTADGYQKSSLTAYISKDKEYYVFKISSLAMSDISGSGDDTRSFGNISAEIYRDNDIYMIKFDEYISASDTEMTFINSDYIGKWIQLPKEADGGLLNVPTSDSTLDMIKSLISQNIADPEKIEFKNENGVYTYESEESDESGESSEKISLTVNLVNPQSPYFEFSSDEKDESGYIYTSTAVKVDNINNTVINVNSGSDSIMLDVDTDYLFITEDITVDKPDADASEPDTDGLESEDTDGSNTDADITEEEN